MKTEKARGFSLIELMTTLVIAAIVLSIGIPAFREFSLNNQMAAAINDLVSTLHMSRTDAVKRRANVTICPSANWNSATPACDAAGNFADGWISFVDCTVAPPPVNTCGAPNLNVDAFDTVLSTHGPVADEIADNSSTNPGAPAYVSFSATGFPRTVVGVGQPPKTDFQFCDSRGNHDVGGGIAAGRWLRISPTGRPQIYRERVAVQSAQNPLNGC